jgi:hypothetical protein
MIPLRRRLLPVRPPASWSCCCSASSTSREAWLLSVGRWCWAAVATAAVVLVGLFGGLGLQGGKKGFFFFCVSERENEREKRERRRRRKRKKESSQARASKIGRLCTESLLCLSLSRAAAAAGGGGATGGTRTNDCCFVSFSRRRSSSPFATSGPTKKNTLPKKRTQEKLTARERQQRHHDGGAAHACCEREPAPVVRSWEEGRERGRERTRRRKREREEERACGEGARPQRERRKVPRGALFLRGALFALSLARALNVVQRISPPPCCVSTGAPVQGPARARRSLTNERERERGRLAEREREDDSFLFFSLVKRFAWAEGAVYVCE